MSRVRLAFALALAAIVAGAAAPASSAAYETWPTRVQAARDYQETRSGVVSFAVVDERGVTRGYRPWLLARSASVLKAMLMVTYLNQSSVRDRPLRDSDRRLLAPMIRWSDNGTATTIRNRVGAAAIYRIARRAGMKRFRLRSPWGYTEICAVDQARFFYRIDSFVPARHRPYAMWLLASIVPSQRWGIPPVKPDGWRIYFKGGWGSGTGAVTHQIALLRNGDQRIAIAVLTRNNPSHTYGTRTITGVAWRLLRGVG